MTRGIYVKVRTTKVKGTSKAILGSVSAGPRFKDALARNRPQRAARAQPSRNLLSLRESDRLLATVPSQWTTRSLKDWRGFPGTLND